MYHLKLSELFVLQAKYCLMLLDLDLVVWKVSEAFRVQLKDFSPFPHCKRDSLIYAPINVFKEGNMPTLTCVAFPDQDAFITNDVVRLPQPYPCY
eukprot:scaffold137952_cov17-Tisochrysis_lutea.AAC.1